MGAYASANPPFQDRADAGRRLAQAVQALELTDPLVLALPRGGVPLAALIARALKAPLDLLLVRKIGAPGSPEFAVAAVADGPEPLIEIDQETMALGGASMEYIQSQVPRHLEEIKRRRRVYLKDRAPLPVQGKTVILVDDGIATGTTARAAIRIARRRGAARIVLAVPVAQADEAVRLRAQVDQLVCLSTPASLGAVGLHYRDFEQVSDDEVIAIMDGAP